MKLSIVFPMFWGRTGNDIWHEGDHFYDHPTALDDEGTIPALFESMATLKDRDWDVIAVAGAGHPDLAAQTEETARSLLTKYSEKAGVTLNFFSYSHLERLHAWLDQVGKPSLKDAVSLVGYSPLRNACLVAAQLLGRDVAVSVDDDCVFIDENYITRIREKIGSDFEGRPILAYTGPYQTPSGSILLDQPKDAHDVFLNGIEAMNAAFRKYLIDQPGLKDCPFAIMGNIAVHRDFFTSIPLDPPMRRGEDMDWVMNSHILGERFVMDPELPIRHDPPPRPHPPWKPLREDIYRFFYQRRKILKSREGNGANKLDMERYMPYPGTFFRDDYFERVTHGCLALSMKYMLDGQNDNARETLNNIYHAKVARDTDDDPFRSYLQFRAKWQEMMSVLEDKREQAARAVWES